MSRLVFEENPVHGRFQNGETDSSVTGNIGYWNISEGSNDISVQDVQVNSKVQANHSLLILQWTIFNNCGHLKDVMKVQRLHYSKVMQDTLQKCCEHQQKSSASKYQTWLLSHNCLKLSLILCDWKSVDKLMYERRKMSIQHNQKYKL